MADEGADLPDLVGKEGFCLRERFVTTLFVERLKASRNMYVDDLRFGREHDAVLFVGVTERNDLELQSAERKSRHIKEFEEPFRDEGADDPLDELTFLRFVSEVKNGILENCDVNASFFVFLAQIFRQTEEDQKLRRVFVNGKKLCRAVRKREDPFEIATDIFSVETDRLRPKRRSLGVRGDLFISVRQKRDIAFGIFALFQKII
jgi:hypothetical protein